ncbi:MAG: efflux RND transporter periplasmic adaptor subunit [Acidobacteria bacterium]|nr:efflux RND transporter periplasmic adaptor subunit [Acidobacteriota bacterium]
MLSFLVHSVRPVRRRSAWVLAALLGVTLVGCGGDTAPANARDGAAAGRSEHGAGRPGARPDGAPPWGGGGPATAAVPVEVTAVERRDIAAYLETNGVLEAETEVDVVARTSGPIVELAVEEGRKVAKGQLMARIDDRELRAKMEVSRVAHEEARLAHDRAKNLFDQGLISSEDYEAARSRFETTAAQLESDRLQLAYTRVEAPFAGRVVVRYVDPAQQVSVNTPLFRLSDFTPLLCPIQVPERELRRIAVGQPAYLTVEAWPGQRFEAKVQRVRPVVDAETGTVRVTLEVDGQDKLSPGMFARVFLQTETRTDTLVIPKTALALESVGDTVYVAEDGVAHRREVMLGFREGDTVEVLSGLKEGERVVVVGQQSLSDGTPIQILAGPGAGEPPVAPAAAGSDTPGAAGQPPGAAGGPPGGPRAGSGWPGAGGGPPSPEQLEQIKERMRARGMSEEQIEERLRQRRAEAGGGSTGGGGRPGGSAL